MRRYVFSEFTSFPQLTRPETLELLREHALTIYLAISPNQVEPAVRAIRTCQLAGLTIGLWPLLHDSEGRWASTWNGTRFAGYCQDLLRRLGREGIEPSELLVDLEPPIFVMKEAIRGRLRVPEHVHSGGDQLIAFVERMSRHMLVSAAVAPWAVTGWGRAGWQRIMGTPVEGLPFNRVFMMAYTSLLEGYSRGLLSRSHAEALLAHWSKQSTDLYGDRSAVAVGVVGVGALGDERMYRDEDELARDVGICSAAGVKHVALYNLRGVLDRNPRPWLEALSTPTRVDAPPQTKRIKALLAVLNTAGRVAASVLR